MLVFFATWCPHCQDGVQIISELEGEYGDLRVIMAGIDGEDDPAKVQSEFVEDYGIEGPAIYDPSLGQTYRVSGYPTVYVLNGGGEIRRRPLGRGPRGVAAAPLRGGASGLLGARLAIDSGDARG